MRDRRDQLNQDRDRAERAGKLYEADFKLRGIPSNAFANDFYVLATNGFSENYFPQIFLSAIDAERQLRGGLLSKDNVNNFVRETLALGKQDSLEIKEIRFADFVVDVELKRNGSEVERKTIDLLPMVRGVGFPGRDELVKRAGVLLSEADERTIRGLAFRLGLASNYQVSENFVKEVGVQSRKFKDVFFGLFAPLQKVFILKQFNTNAEFSLDLSRVYTLECLDADNQTVLLSEVLLKDKKFGGKEVSLSTRLQLRIADFLSRQLDVASIEYPNPELINKLRALYAFYDRNFRKTYFSGVNDKQLSNLIKSEVNFVELDDPDDRIRTDLELDADYASTLPAIFSSSDFDLENDTSISPVVSDLSKDRDLRGLPSGARDYDDASRLLELQTSSGVQNNQTGLIVGSVDSLVSSEDLRLRSITQSVSGKKFDLPELAENADAWFRHFEDELSSSGVNSRLEINKRYEVPVGASLEVRACTLVGLSEDGETFIFYDGDFSDIDYSYDEGKLFKLSRKEFVDALTIESGEGELPPDFLLLGTEAEDKFVLDRVNTENGLTGMQALLIGESYTIFVYEAEGRERSVSATLLGITDDGLALRFRIGDVRHPATLDFHEVLIEEYLNPILEERRVSKERQDLERINNELGELLGSPLIMGERYIIPYGEDSERYCEFVGVSSDGQFLRFQFGGFFRLESMEVVELAVSDYRRFLEQKKEEARLRLEEKNKLLKNVSELAPLSEVPPKTELRQVDAKWISEPVRRTLRKEQENLLECREELKQLIAHGRESDLPNLIRFTYPEYDEFEVFPLDDEDKRLLRVRIRIPNPRERVLYLDLALILPSLESKALLTQETAEGYAKRIFNPDTEREGFDYLCRRLRLQPEIALTKERIRYENIRHPSGDVFERLPYLTRVREAKASAEKLFRGQPKLFEKIRDISLLHENPRGNFFRKSHDVILEDVDEAHGTVLLAYETEAGTRYAYESVEDFLIQQTRMLSIQRAQFILRTFDSGEEIFDSAEFKLQHERSLECFSRSRVLYSEVTSGIVEPISRSTPFSKREPDSENADRARANFVLYESMRQGVLPLAAENIAYNDYAHKTSQRAFFERSDANFRPVIERYAVMRAGIPASARNDYVVKLVSLDRERDRCLVRVGHKEAGEFRDLTFSLTEVLGSSSREPRDLVLEVTEYRDMAINQAGLLSRLRLQLGYSFDPRYLKFVREQGSGILKVFPNYEYKLFDSVVIFSNDNRRVFEKGWEIEAFDFKKPGRVMLVNRQEGSAVRSMPLLDFMLQELGILEAAERNEDVARFAGFDDADYRKERMSRLRGILPSLGYSEDEIRRAGTNVLSNSPPPVSPV